MTVYTSICDVRGNKCASESSPHKKHNKKMHFFTERESRFFISAEARTALTYYALRSRCVCIFFYWQRDLLHHTAAL